MNKLLQEKVKLFERLKVKAFDDEDNPITMTIKLDDLLFFGIKDDKSNFIKLNNQPEILVPTSTIKLLRTQIPEREK